MKRIIYAFVALFAIIGFNVNAQHINVDITSANGNIGNIINIPIYIQSPTGTQSITSATGSFQLTDPSVAEIVGVSFSSAYNIANPSTVVFAGHGINMINGLFMELSVQITGPGCTDIILADYIQQSAPPSPVEFLIAGVVYETLGTDIIVDEGEVCANCNYFIEEIGLRTIGSAPYYTNVSGQSTSGYVDYTSPCIVSDFLDVQQSLLLTSSQGNFCYSVFLDNDANGTFETWLSFGNSPAPSSSIGIAANSINPEAIMRVIISDQPVTDAMDTPMCGEVEDYSFCGDCSCNPNNLVLGPITITQTNPNNCDLHFIQVPPVTGCSNVTVNENYNFRFIRSDGLVLQPETGLNFPFPAASFTFPYTGDFIVEVTYTMTDDSGCTHTVGPHYQSYSYTGCDCSILPPPANTHCVYTSGKNFQQLNWDPVQNAVSYEVQLIHNDPSCCSQSTGIVSSQIKATDKLYYRRPKSNCFSWRVRAVCANGTKSEWSDFECSCGPLSPSGGGTGLTGGGAKSNEQLGQEVISDEQLRLTTVPNPANNFVEITLSGNVELSLNQADVIFYDLSGKVVHQSVISLDEAVTINLSSFKSGVYIIKIVDDNTLLSAEKLIVQ